jgi:uncharacterized protein (TIGR00251 family)
VAASLKILLTPRAGTDALVGMQGDELKIRIAAPPVDGAANQALLKFLAKLLGLGSGDLRLTAGQTGRRKIVKIEALSDDELWSRINAHLK